MAVFDLSNAAGFGFNMSGTNSAGWSFVTSDPSVTEELVYDDGSFAIFDVYGSYVIDQYGVSYATDGYNIVVYDVLFRYQGTDILSIENLNLYTTVSDLEAGAWFVRLNGASDIFYGNDYRDVIKGGYGNDALVGYAGNDVLYGEYGNDKLYGGYDRDLLNGGTHNDYLHGGYGIDTLTGSSGYDQFVFDTRASSLNYDFITDFNPAYDTIRVDNAVFTRAGPNGYLAPGAFWKSTTGRAHDSTDRFIYDTDGGQLYYDSNGSGAGGVVKIAQLKAGLALTYKDIVVI
jgi:Ca2+-binding RTX toxin-like protein